MKINYKKRWCNKGYTYTQTIKVNLKTYEELQDKIINEKIMKFPRRKEYIQDDYDINYLQELNNNMHYLNLTTLRFISLFLKNDRLKTNRNTIIEVLEK